MRLYECLYIVKTDVSDDKKETIRKKIEELVAAREGKIVKFDEWGKRKFTYEIAKSFKGYYFLMTFCGGPELVREIERYLKIDEDVLRYQTMLLEREYNAA
ncbi:MAG: 30S ribosomal protein S6 [Deltaproteobacteria bacterium RIFOXYA12_FULL_61_11]|nr:MAG: 30S ribosomal protein S6 [Deltaproteobacteria bacterium RIFOXYA12_FULL_61_11]